MKRTISLLLILGLLLALLAGCAAQAGGTYLLDRVTTEGRRIRPSDLNMNIRFTLDEDGVGTGTYNGIERSFTWSEDGSTVTITGLSGTMVFQKDGKELLLSNDNAVLTFAPEEEED